MVKIYLAKQKKIISITKPEIKFYIFYLPIFSKLNKLQNGFPNINK